MDVEDWEKDKSRSVLKTGNVLKQPMYPEFSKYHSRC